MKYSIEKSYDFDAAHRLLGSFTKKCRSIHGHTFKVVLSIGANSLNENGMVVDFGRLKKFKNYLDDNFDHSLILKKDDILHDLLIDQGQKIFSSESNPTSEYLAVLFSEISSGMFNDERLRVIKVVVYESATSWAVVELDKE